MNMHPALAKLTNTLELAKQPSPDEQAAWQQWWTKVKDQLVTVIPGGFDRAVTGKVEDVPTWISPARRKGLASSLVRPPVKVEAEALRELLHRLKCSVTLSWTPSRKRYYALSKGVLKAEFGEQTLTEDHLNGSRSTPMRSST